MYGVRVSGLVWSLPFVIGINSTSGLHDISLQWSILLDHPLKTNMFLPWLWCKRNRIEQWEKPYMGTAIHHYKDPYVTTHKMENKHVFSWLNWPTKPTPQWLRIQQFLGIIQPTFDICRPWGFHPPINHGIGCRPSASRKRRMVIGDHLVCWKGKGKHRSMM